MGQVLHGSATTTAATGKVCLEAKLDTTATIPPPTSAKAKDGDYARSLRAQITKHAAERDDEAIRMLRQDVFAGKATRTNQN